MTAAYTFGHESDEARKGRADGIEAIGLEGCLISVVGQPAAA